MSDQPETTPHASDQHAPDQHAPDQPDQQPTVGEQRIAEEHPGTETASAGEPAAAQPETQTTGTQEQSLPLEEDFEPKETDRPTSPLSRITAGGWSGRAGTIAIAVGAAVFIMLLIVIGMGIRPGEMAALREQNALLQTQVAEVDVEVDDLVVMVEAELATNQAAIATVAASQAGQEKQIAQLAEYSERLYVFLEVLGEVANRTVAGEDPRLLHSTDTVLLRQTPMAGEAAGADSEEATSTSVPQQDLVGPPPPTQTATPTRNSVSR